MVLLTGLPCRFLAATVFGALALAPAPGSGHPLLAPVPPSPRVTPSPSQVLLCFPPGEQVYNIAIDLLLDDGTRKRLDIPVNLTDGDGARDLVSKQLDRLGWRVLAIGKRSLVIGGIAGSNGVIKSCKVTIADHKSGRPSVLATGSATVESVSP
jgi:hypothetical protein